MKVYTVHEPPSAPDSRFERAEKLEFVADGFSWGAALFGPVYFLAKGQWFGLAIYLVASTMLSCLLSAFGSDPQWQAMALMALNVFAGFEASSLERAWLGFRGWRDAGTVIGTNQAECERRFFESWLTEPSVPAAG